MAMAADGSRAPPSHPVLCLFAACSSGIPTPSSAPRELSRE
eukprot:CAMPEP_0197688136 /NCGR_PEP_ID=MMETSP1338-20131121/104996_1 /TAXON_ID=43686 ORGANISM="Pelagodinium beii, Strain RCC1491" /NCGR_SAMPLE_ID=MMETSP1338 /ASSEMBLY_ACC=CAM_ASM_000754 /LENGTH=40 /DNA_ID= /DNA_START= /DNA_END= /DNA_ORIENTATION=